MTCPGVHRTLAANAGVVADAGDASDRWQTIFGYDGTDSTWLPSSDTSASVITGIDASRVLPGTDLLKVWFATGQGYRVIANTGSPAPGAAPIRLDATVTDVEQALEVGQPAFINDCMNGRLFRVTAINHASGQAELEPGTRYGIGQVGSAGSMVMPVVSHTWYVGTSANLNHRGDPIQSLFQQDGTSAPAELVEGIEDLQLWYGVKDSIAGTTFPGSYLDASLVSDFRDVVTVRIQLTANSVDDAGSSAPDGILRRTFTQTILLRNR